MVTSSDAEVRVDAIDAGADDFIAKPFNRQELLAGQVTGSHQAISRHHQGQTAELADLNQTLEARVDEQVRELEKMNRLRRFLSRLSPS